MVNGKRRLTVNGKKNELLVGHKFLEEQEMFRLQSEHMLKFEFIFREMGLSEISGVPWLDSGQSPAIAGLQVEWV